MLFCRKAPQSRISLTSALPRGVQLPHEGQQRVPALWESVRTPENGWSYVKGVGMDIRKRAFSPRVLRH